MQDLFDWGTLITGIQFLLGAQLILVGIALLLFKSTKPRVWLAFLCLIFGLWFFNQVFYGYWNKSLLSFILIGPDKTIFICPFLLLYFRSYSTENQDKFVRTHLIIPFIFYLLIILFRFQPNIFPAFIHNNAVFTILAMMLFWFYFFITRKELSSNMHKRLIPKAYKKVLFLFYSLYFFLLQVPIWDIYYQMISNSQLNSGAASESQRLYYTIFNALGELPYIYLNLLSFFLFLYALSELGRFKNFFLPNDALISTRVLNKNHEIDALMNHYFIDDKAFKNPDLNLNSCAKELNITKKELIDYFKITNKGLFKDYVNDLRVKELKLLLENNQFNHYDLVGLAKECGFKSKSTFFRVFKQFVGVTPAEFKRNIR